MRTLKRRIMKVLETLKQCSFYPWEALRVLYIAQQDEKWRLTRLNSGEKEVNGEEKRENGRHHRGAPPAQRGTTERHYRGGFSDTAVQRELWVEIFTPCLFLIRDFFQKKKTLYRMREIQEWQWAPPTELAFELRFLPFLNVSESTCIGTFAPTYIAGPASIT